MHAQLDFLTISLLLFNRKIIIFKLIMFQFELTHFKKKFEVNLNIVLKHLKKNTHTDDHV